MILKCSFNSLSKRQYSTFERLGVPPSVTERLKSRFNVTHPTLAQEQFIPAILKGQRDLLLRDQTGTGKTFGTAIALASLISPSQHVASLYVVPNQELAYQITDWIQQLTDHQQQVQVVATVNADMDRPSHTLIATPGRLLDCFDQLPSFNRLERLVLDEADQALSLPKRYATVRQQNKRMQHPKPAERLLDRLASQSHQTIITSATLNRPLRHFMVRQKEWLRDPLFVDLNEPKDMTVKHHCLLISDSAIRNIGQEETSDATVDFDDADERMIETVATLQEVEDVDKAVLFVGPTVSVTEVQEKLAEYNIKSDDIKNYNNNNKTSRLWIATEFSARGVDIPGVSHVFILGKPASVTSYLHMAGRTGRLGPSGFSRGKVINIVREHGWNGPKMLNLYAMLNIPVDRYEHVD